MPKMPVAAQTTFRPAFAEVALPVPLRKTFTYRLSAEQSDRAAIGSRIIVPFGKRTLTGYITGLVERPSDDLSIEAAQIREAVEIADDQPLLTPEVLDLAEWISAYYLMPIGEVLKAALPSGIDQTAEEIVSLIEPAPKPHQPVKPRRSEVTAAVIDYLRENGSSTVDALAKGFGRSGATRALKRLEQEGFVERTRRITEAKIKPKMRKSVRIVTRPNDLKSLSDAQRSIIETLTSSGGEMFFTDLLSTASVGASPVNTLAKRGFVEVNVGERLRDPIADGTVTPWAEVELNSEQAFALSEIEKAVQEKRFEAFLLKGVTGSGKTEVYLRAMATTLEQGRSSLMLVPEIALTPIFSRRLRHTFGRSVAILHSNLSHGERFDEWRRIHSGDASVVIGTRSAIFAPLRDIGLIIVDEEHDASYRQSDLPYYNARDAAVLTASRRDAVVVLGSATPSLESFQNAKLGKYHLLELTKRIEDRPMAAAELIDMREEFRRAGGRDIALSNTLAEAIRQTHSRGEQSIVLLNRRGYSAFVMCRSCGQSLRCENCDVTLTHHKASQKLVCHYCNFTTKVPKVCPECESEYLYFIGEGTERIEEMIAAKFPWLRIERVDRDTMKRKGQIERILLAFDRGEIDMLVGTQMLAKGHDFHNVTLVGVISVDVGLGLPDFRAAERTFQLLTQVAGRAGRGVAPGRVLIQTYYPEHYALRFAVEQNFEGFFDHEIRFRERMGFPPSISLALIKISHRDRAQAEKIGRILRTGLDRFDTGRQCRILGPALSSISRIKGQFRFQIIIKAPGRTILRTVIDPALDYAGADLRSITVAIDPVNMM